MVTLLILNLPLGEKEKKQLSHFCICAVNKFKYVSLDTILRTVMVKSIFFNNSILKRVNLYISFLNIRLTLVWFIHWTQAEYIK